jgi:predicted nucleic acid-binding protein
MFFTTHEKKMGRIGLDTGFFVRLTAGHTVAAGIWQRIVSEKSVGVVSCLTLFELQRLSFQNRLKPEREKELQRIIPAVCEVVWLGEGAEEILFQSAKHAQTFGIPAIDALILTSLLSANVKEIYTTDPDMERFKTKRVKINRLV